MVYEPAWAWDLGVLQAPPPFVSPWAMRHRSLRGGPSRRTGRSGWTPGPLSYTSGKS